MQGNVAGASNLHLAYNGQLLVGSVNMDNLGVNEFSTKKGVTNRNLQVRIFFIISIYRLYIEVNILDEEWIYLNSNGLKKKTSWNNYCTMVKFSITFIQFSLAQGHMWANHSSMAVCLIWHKITCTRYPNEDLSHNNSNCLLGCLAIN